jgi:phosphoglycolate phosphatase
MRKVIFDGDGTLYDSGKSIKRSCLHTLEVLNYPAIDPDKLDFFVGPPLRESFRLCSVKETDLDRACGIYRLYQKENCLFDIVPYDGILSLIPSLKKDGYLIYLGTSRAYDVGKRLVEHVGLDKYFDGYFGADKDGSHALKDEILKKVDESTPKAEISYMIGDTYMDIDAGRKVGYKTVGCLYGYGDEKRLKASKPDYLISDPKEMFSIL